MKFRIVVYVFGNLIWEVIEMDKQQKKDNEKFNSITHKKKVENQNQEHNVRMEGIGPINQKR